MKDRDILNELYENEKWDGLDYYIGRIIESKDKDRYQELLDTFQNQRNDKMFKYLLDDIEKKLDNLKN